jgi:hypothetical protein
MTENVTTGNAIIQVVCRLSELRDGSITKARPVTPSSSSFALARWSAHSPQPVHTPVRRWTKARCATTGWSVPATKQRSASATARCWSRRRWTR